MNPDQNHQESLRAARDYAARRLARREHSEGELRQLLARREVAPDLIDQVIRELQERGYLSDSRYARAVIRDQSARGKGPRYIRQKLTHKGVRLEVGEIAREQESSSGRSLLEAAREIVERRYPTHASDAKTAKRAFDALLRRGFSFEVASQIVRRPTRRGAQDE